MWLLNPVISPESKKDGSNYISKIIIHNALNLHIKNVLLF